jgi:hypothetical protein
VSVRTLHEGLIIHTKGINETEKAIIKEEINFRVSMGLLMARISAPQITVILTNPSFETNNHK